MLEEVFVPSKGNVHGELYGFVRFSKVKDVGKLLKAMNVVCFGHFCVRAKVARFDHNVSLEGKRERDGEGVREVGREDVGRKAKVVVGVEGSGGKKNVGEGEKRVSMVVHGVGGGCKEVVLSEGEKGDVGEVFIKVREVKGKGGRGGGEPVLKEGNVVDVVREKGDGRVRVVQQQQPVVQKLVEMYRSRGDDLKWACLGVIASVVNGEAIPVVQNRIEDARFTDLEII